MTTNNPNEKRNKLIKNIVLGILTFGLYLLLKKPEKKKSVMREWVDAILFAVIAATIIRALFIEAFTIPTSSMEKSLMIGDFLFVSKVSYGARIPMTPIAFPFAHHTMPMTDNVKSYMEWLKIPYTRLPGLGKIKNNDIVVFNYPMEDFRPVDKREHYIKRCVGLPGDKLEVKGGDLYINDKLADMPEKMQMKYHVRTNGSDFNPKTIREMDITEGGRISEHGDFELSLTPENRDKMMNFGNVVHVERMKEPKDEYAEYIFPHHPHYKWNVDNFGALEIPKEGATVKLDLNNLPLYKRIIEVYENNQLEVKDGRIFINGKESDSYTFKMDYYFMMGDNRHNSADSRFWGFVPNDHIVGKAVFVWLSIDSNASSIFTKVRWNRVCTFVSRDGLSSSFLWLVLLIIGGIWFYNHRQSKKTATGKK
jgi:signal peptidase I